MSGRSPAWLVAGVLVSLISSEACAREELPGRQVLEDRSGWSYWSEPSGSKRGRVLKLSFAGREVTGPWTLVTPIGEFQVIAAEDPQSSSGWHKVSGRASSEIPQGPASLSATDLAKRFFPSDDKSKPAEMPPSWIYVGGIPNPGWADPSLLFDSNFWESHYRQP